MKILWIIVIVVVILATIIGYFIDEYGYRTGSDSRPTTGPTTPPLERSAEETTSESAPEGEEGMGISYHGYVVEPKYIKEGKIEWKNTGNGDVITVTKGGKKYRLKKRVGLVYPSSRVGDVKVSEAQFKVNKAKADYVVNKQNRLKTLMSDLSVDKDKIVVEEDHFWDNDDKKYVTVMRYIDPILPNDYNFKAESDNIKLELFKCMAVQLDKIHTRHIIHSDLKPENFMFAKERGMIVSYLIDFDGSYPDNEVPSVEDPIVGGGPTYTEGWDSPEIQDYIFEEDDAYKRLITTKTDIFTLGLIFHKLFTGAVPLTSIDGANVARVIRKGGSFELNLRQLNKVIGPNCNTTYASLINWMLYYDVANKSVEKRPTAKQVLDVLNDKIPVPEEHFYKGSKDVAKYSSLHELDKKYATLDIKQLERMGVARLRQLAITGKGESAKREYLLEYRGVEKTVNILYLINNGFVTPIDIPSSTYPDDDINIVPAKALRSLGIVSINPKKLLGTDGYEIIKFEGRSDFVRKDKKKELLDKKYAYKKGEAAPTFEEARVETTPTESATIAAACTAASAPVRIVDTCAPWEIDNIVFLSKDELKNKNVSKIERSPKEGRYLVSMASGVRNNFSAKELIIKGFATKKGETSVAPAAAISSSSDFCELFDCDKDKYVINIDKFKERNCKRLVQTTDGTNRYIIYDVDGKVKMTQNANMLANAGYFKRK